jgi:hypothetical protein
MTRNIRYRLPPTSALSLLGLLFGSENGNEYSFETSGSFPTARNYKAEGRIVHSHRCDNLRTSLFFVSLTALCGKSDLILPPDTIAHSTEMQHLWYN